jgi:Carboxypeptidase regulatory-like domain
MPYLAARKSGIVLDPTGRPIRGAEVTLMDSGWKTAFKTVWADEDGRFEFSQIKLATCYLEISRPGFQIMHVKLKIVRRAKTNPRIGIELAT